MPLSLSSHRALPRSSGFPIRLPARSPRLFLSSSFRRGIADAVVFNGHSYSFLWLRDSCQCSQCLHPTTLQKPYKSLEVYLDERPATNGVQTTVDGLDITWDSGHQSHYPRRFLERHISLDSLKTYHRDVERVEWDVAKIKKARNLFLPYNTLNTPRGLLSAITQLTEFGLLFVTNVPHQKTSEEESELKPLAERFGEIRRTWFGETWDVRTIKNSRNIAYTNANLGLHMDLSYFQHPPRYQILLCLKNRVKGGISIFIDAVHIASRLRAVDPETFNMLATTPVPFHYINDGHHVHYAHPIIQLSRFPSPTTGQQEIEFINWAPHAQSPLPLDTPASFYVAQNKFARMLEDSSLRFEHMLREGDAVLFDNRRVLHSRTAFVDREAETNDEETNRWLKGCYLEADALLDRGRVLRSQLQEVKE